MNTTSEILKKNFKMCKVLLELFEDVNDPYVIQRLYGVVFGATMKRTDRNEAEFSELSEYIFNTVFNKDMVYPDILLRDYARLIIERWLYEFPDNSGQIKVDKVRPPYRSEAIPVVKEEKYEQKDVKNSGFSSIDSSMTPEGFGWYGDFGRYVFQSNVDDFDGVDVINLYHYAMQYIRDELGYTDDMFGEYDYFKNYHDYNRHNTAKIERIGKKYQWITMYNILARLSDTHKVKESWGDKKLLPYNGAWEPYVRDFDPTLNCNFLVQPDLPCFSFIGNNNEFIDGESADEPMIQEWLKSPCEFFKSHSSKLLLEDNSGQVWIPLNFSDRVRNESYNNSSSSRFDKGSQELWSMSHGYIVSEDEFELFKNELEKKNNRRGLPSAYRVYQLFNREYAWSPGYLDIFGNGWHEYEVQTGEKRITKHKGRIPNLDALFKRYSGDVEDEKLPIITYEEKEWESTEEVTEVLGRVMTAYSELLWEEQYDASQEETTSFDIPCRDILGYLKLEQKEYDGYFYSQDDTLVAFDGSYSKICNGLLIRKDYLDRYLRSCIHRENML